MGAATGSVTEDDPINTVSGQLSIADQDADEAVFIAQTNASTEFGTFSILADGAWTYAIDNSNATVQGLGLDENGEPETLNDVITVTSADGTQTTVTITINGANEAAEIGGATEGTVTEDTNVDDDDNLIATGLLTITDRDDEAEFIWHVQHQTNVCNRSMTSHR